MGEISQQDLIDTITGNDTAPAQEQVTTEQQPAAVAAPINELATDVEKTATAAAPTFNVDEELQKISNGEIKSADDLKAILGKTKDYGTLEARLKTYEDENTSLKAKVAVDPFANDMARKLNEFYKAGAPQTTIDAFIRINKVESIDALQPLEARKLALQIKEGLTADEAETYLSGVYKLKAEDPEDLSEQQKIQHDSIKLKLDANADKEFLKTHKAEVSSLPADPSVAVAQRAQEDTARHIEALSPLVKNVANVLSFKDVNVNGKDGTAAFKMDLELSDESKASLEPALMDYVTKNAANIPNNEAGIEHLKQVGESLLVIQNYKNWIATAVNTREKAVRAEYHNPTEINRGKDNPNQGKTSQQELGEWLLQNA